MGPRSRHAGDNGSVPNEAHPKSQAQSPKQLSTTDHGAKELGFSLETDLLSGANQLGYFNLGSATIQAQNVSVKSKKDFARNRAHITSVNVADGSKSFPRSSYLASISNHSNKTSEWNFLFTASARNELGDKIEGDDLRNSSGGHRGIADQGEKCLDIPYPSHGGECSDGAPVSDGLTRGEVFSAGQTKHNCMEDDSSNPVKLGAIRSDFYSEAMGEKDDGDRATSHMCGEQHSRVLLNSIVEVRPIDGVVEADGLEFEGGGENPTSC